MKALILAAGKGTRLGTLTADCPKPMLAIGGRPLLEHTVVWLRSAGIRELAINLHYLPHVITEYFKDGSAWDVTLHYSWEPTLLGTAGAARKLAAFLDEPFVVVYGDLFTNVRLSRLVAFHEAKQRAENALITLALYRVGNPTECGLVDLDAAGRIMRFVEKPPAAEVFTDVANSGILLCQPAVLDNVPAGAFFDFSHDLIPGLLAAGQRLYGQLIATGEYVIDIGTPAGYALACSAGQVWGPDSDTVQTIERNSSQ